MKIHIRQTNEIREYLSGNLCRCAGYADILRAVRLAQKRIVQTCRAIDPIKFALSVIRPFYSCRSFHQARDKK